uniref:ATP synthase F0 subunit 8 n=1 Tax=Arge aurora TaxID=2728854 RepID=A0A6M5U7R6_9HYME|nr:ATP synthase F0 subunit 8 [Arge aurora]
MPQMYPMMWMNLYLYFLILFFFYMIKLFFFFNKSLKQKKIQTKLIFFKIKW